MGWLPIQFRLQLVVIKLWQRLCTVDSSRLVQQIFMWSCNLADRGQKNWCFHAREILRSLMVFSNVNPAVPQALTYAMSTKHQWAWLGRVSDKNSLNSKSGGRLAIYRSLKCSPRTENYLEEVFNQGIGELWSNFGVAASHWNWRLLGTGLPGSLSQKGCATVCP